MNPQLTVTMKHASNYGCSLAIKLLSCAQLHTACSGLCSNNRDFFIYQLSGFPARWKTVHNLPADAGVQFSCIVVSDSLRPHEPQHAMPPCPSPTPGVYPNLCPLSRRCHLTISSSVVPFSSCLQSFPTSGSFQMSRIRWPKYWSFSFNISPSNEHPGLISFRMDWSDLLAVQGTLKSLLQHHSSKASILLHSAFFTVQLSHPYMTTRKIIALTKWTFVGKVMSLLFNMLSRLVITFLPKSKTWVQSLGQEDLLEKGITTHSSIPTWRIPGTKEPGGLQSMGSQRVGNNGVTNTWTFNSSKQLREEEAPSP